MTQPSPTQQFSDNDAKALATKLQDFAKALPKGEQQATTMFV